MQLEVSAPDFDAAPELGEAAPSTDDMRGERRRRNMEQEMEMEEGISSGFSADTPLIADSASNGDREEKAYETLLNHVGFGKFQILLLLVCGWANASDAVEILCVSFILPSAECELKLSAEGKGILTAIIFFGMMFGGYLWGSIGDSIGRKYTLVTSLLLNSLGGLLSAFASSFEFFTFSRFLSGLGVGGSIPVVWSYFAEFQIAKNRGTMLSLLACSWMVGNIITACLAWAIIPNPEMQWSSSLATLSSWRVFVLLCVLPAFSAAILLLFFPESPKFLIKNGRGGEAKTVISFILKMNSGGNSAAASVEDLKSSLFVDDKDTKRRRDPSSSTFQHLTLLLKQLISKTRLLFRPPHARNNAVMLVIFFTISFGYYGMWLWMPELFSMASKKGVSPCALFAKDEALPVGESSTPSVDSSTASNASATPSCAPTVSAYQDSLISTVATLPGNLVSIFCVDRLGRKPLLIISMVVSGISVFFIPLVTTEAHLLVLSCCFGGFSVIGWNALDCLSCELFPTELRSTAIGLQLGLGRIAAIVGNLVFGELIAVNCAIPILLVSVCMIVGGFVSLKLPQTTGILLS